MTTRNKRKSAALNKENCEEHPRSNLAQNSNAPRSQEDYITQVSEGIEGRVTKRLSKEFSRTKNRILGALARVDDFLMNPLLQGHSGTTPEPSRNALSTSQGTNEDDFQNDPHPEAGLFHGQMTQNSGPEDDHDIYRAFTLGLFLWNWHYRLEISKNTLPSSPFFQNIRIYSVLDIVSFDLCPLYIFLNRFAFEHGKYSEASLSDHALEILSLGLVFFPPLWVRPAYFSPSL